MARPNGLKPDLVKCGKCGSEKFATPRGWVCPNNLECGERIVPFAMPGYRPGELYNTTDDDAAEDGESVCSKCKGSGDLDCAECGGSGEVECGECGHEHECDDCDGFGSVECDQCGGTGTLDKAAAHMSRARTAGAFRS